MADPTHAQIQRQYAEDLSIAALSLRSFLASCARLGIDARLITPAAEEFAAVAYRLACGASLATLPQGDLEFQWNSNVRGAYDVFHELETMARSLSAGVPKRPGHGD